VLTEEGLIYIPGIFSRWATLRSGARAHYVTAGETGPSVVLLHGGIHGSSGLAGWNMMIPFLAQNGFRVYAPDRPGFGLCDIRPEHWMEKGVRDQVRFLNEFVEAVGLEDQFFLGGNSQGAQMGSSYAVEYPDKVKRMILIASPAFHARIGLGNGMGRGDNSPLPFDGTEKWMRDSMERIIMNKAVIMDELITMRTNMANRDLQCFTAGREYGQYEIGDPNLLQAIDFRGRLDTITVPTSFLWGKDDVLAPVAMGYELEDVLTNMQFFFPNECGHQGQTDQPEMLNRVFLEFFRDGVVSRKAADWAGVSTRRAEKPHLIEQAVPANG
jgi:2-hydroxy-6-oxonona-2,4-dienedioate hydrolase